MILFDRPGKDATLKTAEIAAAKAKELGCDLVIASRSGFSANALLDAADQLGYSGTVVVVRGASTAQEHGINRMLPETKAQLEARGAVIVTAAHALSAGERSFSGSFRGAYPLEMMAHTLRTFGQGVKVCFECAVMALDADALTYGRPIVSVGGTGSGADTALVLTPSYSSTITQTLVHEILCKPGLYSSAESSTI